MGLNQSNGLKWLIGLANWKNISWIFILTDCYWLWILQKFDNTKFASYTSHSIS